MADSAWKPLDSAPRRDEEGNPVPVLLFLPSLPTAHKEDGRPEAVFHARVVGWWDDQWQAWVTGIHPHGATVMAVFPSLWAELLAEPELPK